MKKIKRIVLKANHRIPIIAVLIIVSIFSIGNILAAFQQPTTVEKNVIKCNYSHRGDFKYIVYLKNNTVYGTNMLLPGQGTVFKKITDHINGSLFYTFRCNKPTNINGSYIVYGELRTNLWKKKMIILPRTYFSSNENVIRFNQNIRFPINFTYFESIFNKITEETGVKTGDPTLAIRCEISVHGVTTDGIIQDFFYPTLNITLGKDIIEFPSELLYSKAGFLEETVSAFQPQVVEQRQRWILPSIFFPIVLTVFLIFTRSEQTSKSEKALKKIEKKYGEWIVEVEKLPAVQESVPMKSIEDLVKISEEIGKPIMHYELDKKHLFCVFDESIKYEYSLPPEEKIKKIARCPECGNEIVCEEFPGKEVMVTCPKCGKEGIISFEKTTFWKKIFER